MERHKRLAKILKRVAGIENEELVSEILREFVPSPGMGYIKIEDSYKYCEIDRAMLSKLKPCASDLELLAQVVKDMSMVVNVDCMIKVKETYDTNSNDNIT